ncbi:hypothetical protein B0H13DRAFT_2362440 [Mycena leptocephala]|nr:hypothetical protein B0H13DRAFT_2362440 [Mycena leptocephala]
MLSYLDDECVHNAFVASTQYAHNKLSRSPDIERACFVLRASIHPLTHRQSAVPDDWQDVKQWDHAHGHALCSPHIFHFASLWMDRLLALAARCPGVFGRHSTRTQPTESSGILSPPKSESAQSISTPAFASMPPHHHSHDRHPHPQQKRTGPGAPEHMRAGDCGREARGDREREWEWGWRGKDDEESEMTYLRHWPVRICVHRAGASVLAHFYSLYWLLYPALLEAKRMVI